MKEWYQKNKEKIREQQKEYWQKNRKKINEYRQRPEIKTKRKEYLLKNKEHKKEWQKNRYKTDLNHKNACILRSRIYSALKNNTKSASTMKLLGCSIEFFKHYYESKFTKGMSWAKVMNGEIHCDHIIPCSRFNQSNPQEQRQCWNYTNLQPLWAKENLEKYDKILQEINQKETQNGRRK